MDRKSFLKKLSATGVGIASLPTLLNASPKQMHDVEVYQPVKPQITAPKGAIYLPAQAYNTWQQWKNYSQKETERDFGYAQSIGLNSLRIWLSYEYWLENPKRHMESLDHMLDAADKKGIKVLLALFDSCGVENTKAARENLNPRTAVAVKSPSLAISRDVSKWNGPERFVNVVMERHANDKRLVAIEVMNEPGFADNRIAMSRFLFKAAKRKQGSIPLTIGSLQGMQNWGNFMDLGIDLLEYHYNFPTSIGDFKRKLHTAKQVAKALDRPLWITEWQMLRKSGNGWNGKKIPEKELMPDLASLAGTVYKSGIGNHFWSLMFKPAYLTPQRKIGTFNGLFHEDGSVYSLADARAVSQNPHFQAEERKAIPDWAK
ncbi:MAG TPA: hypothetical protein VJ991_16470 [Balneolales bacterium]|nr:hypothetical protein [Balneolales bacterium]